MSLSITPSESGSVAASDLLGAIASAFTSPSAQPIYVKNAQHQWIYVNAAGASLIGLGADAIIGRSEADFLPQQVAQQLTQQDDHFFSSQQVSTQPISFNLGCQMAGHRQLINIAGQPALVNTLQNVTELTHAQNTNETLTKKLRANQEELDTALHLESTLKRITDRVRDSLDEQQILQTAVDELVKALNIKAANTALYDLEQGTSTVYYECSAGLAPVQGRVSQMEAYSEVYQLLLAGQYLQFCSTFPNPERGLVSMFAAPILDDRDVLGDLWLINDADSYLSELDIRLVQQVTNQCAIAIRQARLYQESQSQVRELEPHGSLKIRQG